MLRLKHMIVSHHGEYGYGSPKLPMTWRRWPCIASTISTPRSTRSSSSSATIPTWTAPGPPSIRNLERKLFKGKQERQGT